MSSGRRSSQRESRRGTVVIGLLLFVVDVAILYGTYRFSRYLWFVHGNKYVRGEAKLLTVVWAVIATPCYIYLTYLLFEKLRKNNALMSRLAAKKRVMPFDDVGRPEQVIRTLKKHAATAQGPEVVGYLQRTLPDWPASQALIRAVGELFLLKTDITRTMATVAPAEVAGTDLRRTQEIAAELLWIEAERLTVVGASAMQTPRIRQQLERETQRMTDLHQAIVGAREALAEVVLSGGGGRRELEEVKRSFGRLILVVQSAEDLENDGL